MVIYFMFLLLFFTMLFLTSMHTAKASIQQQKQHMFVTNGVVFACESHDFRHLSVRSFACFYISTQSTLCVWHYFSDIDMCHKAISFSAFVFVSLSQWMVTIDLCRFFQSLFFCPKFHTSVLASGHCFFFVRLPSNEWVKPIIGTFLISKILETLNYDKFGAWSFAI